MMAFDWCYLRGIGITTGSIFLRIRLILYALFSYTSRADRSWENGFWDYPGDHHIEAMRTDYGLKTIVHWPGPTPDTLYVRLTTLALPTVFSLGGRGVEEEGFERLLFVTPVDDDNFMVYSSDFVPGSKEDVIKKRDQSRYAPPAAEPVKEYDKRKYCLTGGRFGTKTMSANRLRGKSVIDTSN